jgi:septal ring factor EnvC (AmiA/AmiB activator)
MNKSEMLDSIKQHYQFKSNAEFARHLGISSSALGNWYFRETFDAELIYTKCEGLSAAWLIIGGGPMLSKDADSYSENKLKSVAQEPEAKYKTSGDFEQEKEKLEGNIKDLRVTVSSMQKTIELQDSEIARLKKIKKPALS